eukprot:CAMPEP_0170422984 /NCGR_PEP_ID=MMETSP0117_2-20130122/36754_1 /TAXON_ID=400756 /ORGANISM="Durinskia baltica, Strain CSIRO CS-38" /LENGTH=171 /DNA_ID=CAMNT_0010681699 /DNA_START=65 /DNA_END=576 /DNA_ORIENTATION=+
MTLPILPRAKTTRLFAKTLRPKPKRSKTWEEKYEVDPLKSDYPTEDYHPPVDPFTKWFACYAQVESLPKRSEAWTHHMQWARRSILAQGMREKINDTLALTHDLIPSVIVEDDFTLLSDDRMGPIAQILIIRSNHTIDALSYLSKEPLSRHGGVSPWKIFELKLEQHLIDP